MNPIDEAAPHEGADRNLDLLIAGMVQQPKPLGLGENTLTEAAQWMSTNSSPSKVAWAQIALAAATVFVLTAGASYAFWGPRPTSNHKPPAEQHGPHNAPAFAKSSIDATQHAEANKSGIQQARATPALMGVYPSTYRGVVAGDATVIVATGRRKPLPLGAYTPYREGGDTLHIWDWSKSAASRVMPNVRLWPKEEFAISPDGKQLVWPNGKVLELSTGKQSKIDLGGESYHSGAVSVRRINRLEFTPDGKRLAVHINDLDLADSKHALRRHELKSRGMIQLLSFPEGRMLAQFPAGRLLVAYPPNAKRVISAIPPEQYGQQLIEYDANSGDVVRMFEPSLKGFAYSIATSPKGKYVAAYDDKTGVMIWDWESGRLLHRLEDLRQASYATVLEFSNDERFLALNGADKVVIVNVASGDRIATLKQSSSRQIRWSPDDERLTVVSGNSLYEGGPLRLYNMHISIFEWDWRQGVRTKSMTSTPPR